MKSPLVTIHVATARAESRSTTASSTSQPSAKAPRRPVAIESGLGHVDVGAEGTAEFRLYSAASYYDALTSVDVLVDGRLRQFGASSETTDGGTLTVTGFDCPPDEDPGVAMPQTSSSVTVSAPRISVNLGGDIASPDLHGRQQPVGLAMHPSAATRIGHTRIQAPPAARTAEEDPQFFDQYAHLSVRRMSVTSVVYRPLSTGQDTVSVPYAW
jgi:hypothetical protein